MRPRRWSTRSRARTRCRASPPSHGRSSARRHSIQGFATAMSVNKGETVSSRSRPRRPYHIDILRLGYYGGNGARMVAANITPTARSATQPACQTFATTGLIDCGNWSVSASWAVPSTAVSGVYIAHLVRNDTGGSSQIVVRRPRRRRATPTWSSRRPTPRGRRTTPTAATASTQCAVTCPAGNPGGYKAASKVSYNRPFTPPTTRAAHRGCSPGRVPDDPVPRSQRLRRELHERPRRQPTAVRCS